MALEAQTRKNAKTLTLEKMIAPGFQAYLNSAKYLVEAQ
jgi:hypothetical protein